LAPEEIESLNEMIEPAKSPIPSPDDIVPQPSNIQRPPVSLSQAVNDTASTRPAADPPAPSSLRSSATPDFQPREPLVDCETSLDHSETSLDQREPSPIGDHLPNEPVPVQSDSTVDTTGWSPSLTKTYSCLQREAWGPKWQATVRSFASWEFAATGPVSRKGIRYERVY
jgi:hypothetical protein